MILQINAICDLYGICSGPVIDQKTLHPNLSRPILSYLKNFPAGAPVQLTAAPQPPPPPPHLDRCNTLTKGPGYL